MCVILNYKIITGINNNNNNNNNNNAVINNKSLNSPIPYIALQIPHGSGNIFSKFIGNLETYPQKVLPALA
jgi:hypothetical protein